MIGPFRGLNPGPPAPEAGIIPLDQTDDTFRQKVGFKKRLYQIHCQAKVTINNYYFLSSPLHSYVYDTRWPFTSLHLPPNNSQDHGGYRTTQTQTNIVTLGHTAESSFRSITPPLGYIKTLYYILPQ